MTNTIDQELYNYFLQLSDAKKESVLQLLKTFVQRRKDFPERISIEQYNRELETSEEMEAGHFTTLEDLEKEMEKW